jgi:tetratricopeptide (TPR) repeat protein
MASVKRDQILQEAEKLVARGKLDAAVREYRRALEQVPNDTNTLNRLGDLLVKANRIPEAIDAYQRVAEHFATDGFFLKSIAIYKKVNRLDPQRTDTYERLADLYFKQGLIVEGRQNLVTLADWFVRSRQLDEAVRIYRRLAEFEPTNFQARAKLVDLLVQAGDVAGATEEIDGLGKALMSRGMLEEAIKLYHRALELGPESADFLAPCIDLLVKGGRTAQAVELAKRGLATGKGGDELKRAAASALADSGDFSGARELLEGLMPEAGERTDVIQLYGDIMIRSGESASAKEKILPVVDRLIAAKETARAVGIMRRFVREAAADIDVLERAVQVFDRRQEPDLLLSSETALADAYYDAQRESEALELYRRLHQLVPENVLFAQRYEELGGRPAGPLEATQKPQDLGEKPPPVVEVVASAEPTTEEIEFVDVDFSEEAAESDSAEVPTSAGAGTASAVSAGAGSPGAASASTVAELYTEAVVLAKYGLTEKAVGHLQRILSMDAGNTDARQLLASLGAAPAAVPASPPRAAAPEPSAASNAAESSFEPVLSAAPPQADRSGIGRVRIEDLEAILGLGEVGRAAAESRAASPPGSSPEFDFHLATAPGAAAPSAAAAALEWSTAEPPAPAVEESSPPATVEPAAAGVERSEEVEVLEEPVELVEMGEVLAGPTVEQLRETDFFIQQGLLEEAARLIARLRESFPDHPEVMARQALLKARGWEETAPAVPAERGAAELFSEEEQFFDLAAELEKELAEDEIVAEARGGEPSGEVSIEELFREFQRGVAEQVSEEDFDTHYNLGLAYREMGLLDEAIGEFQLAGKFPGLFVESASMVGSCYLDKGLPDEAAEWFSRALTSPDLVPDVECGLRFELAGAYESAGNLAAALAQYVEVLNTNPGFRDVVEQVARLQKQTN